MENTGGGALPGKRIHWITDSELWKSSEMDWLGEEPEPAQERWGSWLV